MGATPQIPLGTFDPANVVLTWGAYTIVGFAKGSYIKVSLDSPQYTDDVGANGDPVRVKNNDQRGSIEIELMQSSPSNNDLSDEAALDADGAGKHPVEVIDLNGTTVASGLDAWIEKVTDSEFSTEATNRTWKLRVGRMTYYVGNIN